MSGPIESSLGTSVAIINTLKLYKKKMPLDFLSKKIGRKSSEIKAQIKKLEKAGVVKLEDDSIIIVEESLKKE
jgi:predicted transcriptional regulator